MIRAARKDEHNKNIKKIIKLLYDVFYESNNPLFVKYHENIIKSWLENHFTVDNHFFSYQNCFVYEENNAIKAIILVYFHHDIERLKLNSLNLLKSLIPEIQQSYLEIGIPLSQPKELYLDLISVAAEARGQGIGTKLIEFIYQYYQNNSQVDAISLNVAHDNPKAKKLYEKLKFTNHQVIAINNHPYDHMIRKIK